MLFLFFYMIKFYLLHRVGNSTLIKFIIKLKFSIKSSCARCFLCTSWKLFHSHVHKCNNFYVIRHSIWPSFGLPYTANFEPIHGNHKFLLLFVIRRIFLYVSLANGVSERCCVFLGNNELLVVGCCVR